MEAGEIQKAFGAIKGWYRDAGPRPSKPSKEDIEVTQAEYVELYTPREPTEGPIPLHITPYPINDEPPTEDEVMQSVRKLINNKAAGARGITAENLKDWMDIANPSEEGTLPDPAATVLWVKVLKIVRLAFEEGELPRAFSEGIFVLIPKADVGEYRGIALLEIIYKLISLIINGRLIGAVNFDDSMHGNLPQRGTGTAIMEAKCPTERQDR